MAKDSQSDSHQKSLRNLRMAAGKTARGAPVHMARATETEYVIDSLNDVALGGPIPPRSTTKCSLTS